MKSFYLKLASMLLASVLVIASCSNPTAATNPAETEPDTEGGGPGSATPGSVTITFVLDMVADESVPALTTTYTAPAPLTLMQGEVVRLTQGNGFTALGPGPGGAGSLTYHASGWSTLSYEEQFSLITNPSGPAPNGDGWYLPGLEASFSEDTTLYVRWLPEVDNIAARVSFEEPGTGTATVTGPVMHLRDQLGFEKMSYFSDAMSVPWTVSTGERVWEWSSATNSYAVNAHNITPGSPAVWQFADASNNGTNAAFLYASGAQGLQDILISYSPEQVYRISFNTNGGSTGSTSIVREAFANQPIANNVDWWAMSSSTRLDDPVRGDLSFDSWYLDPGSWTVDWYENATADTTVYANWQASITFDPMGGNGGVVTETLSVDENGTVPVPVVTTPQDTWDVFAGWFADSALTQPVTLVNGRLPVTGDRTIYAGWGPKYEVGDTGPGGGRIFYLADAEGWPRVSASASSFPFNGWKYLEVAPTDAAGAASWATTSMSDSFLTEAGHDSHGGGLAASDQIIGANSGSSLTDYAAYLIRNTYTSNGLGNWYLPSVVELQEIAGSGQWTAVNMGSSRYWSSSSYVNPEYSPDSMGTRAYIVRLSSGAAVVETVMRISGGSTLRARPVRRF